MIKTTRNSRDNTRLLSVTMTERQLASIVTALRELDIIVRYSYNQLSPDEKQHAKTALRELRRTKGMNLLEFSQYRLSGCLVEDTPAEIETP